VNRAKIDVTNATARPIRVSTWINRVVLLASMLRPAIACVADLVATPLPARAAFATLMATKPKKWAKVMSSAGTKRDTRRARSLFK